MNSDGFQTTIVVDRPPEEVYDVINDVRSWWTGQIEGPTDLLDREFTYRYEDVHYSKLKVTQLVPAQRIVWEVTDSLIPGPDDPGEWTGTQVVFEITPGEDGTQVRFTHVGLVPEFGCFEGCSRGWSYYINESLPAVLSAPK